MWLLVIAKSLCNMYLDTKYQCNKPYRFIDNDKIAYSIDNNLIS